MNFAEQKKAAKAFLSRWRGRGDEKQDCQSFWTDLVVNVLGIRYASESIRFEKTVDLGKDAAGRSHTGFIDAYIPDTKVLIEQKGAKIDLRKPALQSDGSELTPYQQAKRYADRMTNDQRPRWIIVSNFQEIIVYDLNASLDVPQVEMKLEDLETEAYRLEFIVDQEKVLAAHQLKVSLEAGELVGKLYDALEKQYEQPMSQAAYQSLNKLCVCLVFCLYAEDSGLFGTKTQFHDYLANRGKAGVGRINTALRDLFRILNTKPEDRDPYEDEDLAIFPYVNGGLFADSHILIPPFTQEAYDLLVNRASEGFDWSEISPTIFGSVFESTLNAETRRQGGMHYTSVENIHKVIDPLFLDELKAAFEALKKSVRGGVITPKKRAEFQHFQEKLGRLKFLDPACGSGNFLTETYLSLRKLENDVLRFIYGGQQSFSEVSPIQVHINQFYGIEINDFAVAVAQAALWIAESQMMNATREIVQINDDFLPLKSAAHIVEGNALRMDWNDVVPAAELNYIMGNPPFVGHQHRTASQKEDMELVFHGSKESYGKVDYVGAWFEKSAKFIQNSSIHCAFVATNSICQGESVAALWRNIIGNLNVNITFAYETFKWVSEASDMAAVHCVIIGFSLSTTAKNKQIFLPDGTHTSANNINGYLVDGPNVFIESRGRCIENALPKMVKGSQPTDDGNLFLTEDEYQSLVSSDPESTQFIKQFFGAKEFINNTKRYCFWFKDVSPHLYSKNKEILARISRVKSFRLKSPTDSVRKDAEKSYLFTQIRQPDYDYLLIPRHSGENRSYIPIGFVSKDVICGDANYLIPTDSKFIFGVLTSKVHMAWMRTVAGRIKSDYRYTPAVYNTFPWKLDISENEKNKIIETANAILKAREAHPEATLFDLYSAAMPEDLLEAHRKNDRAVMKAYGFKSSMTESEIVAELFKLYQKKVNELAEAEAAQKVAKKPRKRKAAATAPAEPA